MILLKQRNSSRKIRDVNVALGAIKTSKFGKDVKKIGTDTKKAAKDVDLAKIAFTNLAKTIAQAQKNAKKNMPPGGMKSRVKKWLQGAGAAVDTASDSLFKKLTTFVKNIDIKTAAVRVAMAALGSATAGVFLAAGQEDAERLIAGKQQQEGLDRLKKQYEVLIALSGGIFTKGDIAKAAVSFLERHNNMNHLMGMLPHLVKIAKGSGEPLSDVAERWSDTLATGSERGVIKDSGHTSWNEREIERLKILAGP